MNASERKGLNRLTARFLFVALAPFALDGCVSVGVERTAPPAEADVVSKTGALEARLYDTGSAAKDDRKSPREVSWKLFLLSNSSDALVGEGTGNVWNVTGLEPGRYRLVATWGPAPGVPGDTSAGTKDDTFKLAAGETAAARVIVRKFPTGWVVGAGVAIAVGIAVGVTVSRCLPLGCDWGSSSARSLSPSAVDPPR